MDKLQLLKIVILEKFLFSDGHYLGGAGTDGKIEMRIMNLSTASRGVSFKGKIHFIAASPS
jgi:hypothetical protein